jgi:molybdopterin synthase sulfur carrier subunit
MSALTLLYFAWVRERIGAGEEQVARPPAGTTIAQLLDALAGTSPGHAAAFAERAKLRAALDQRFVPLDTAIGEAAELALFPPVTGG